MCHSFSFLASELSFPVSTYNVDFILWDVEKLSKHREKKSWFAGANFSNDANKFTFLDLEVDVFEGDDLI